MTTYTWLGSGSGADWADISGWSPAGVPGADDNAVISASASQLLTVTRNDESVDNLTLDAGARLDIRGGGVLTVYGALDDAGAIDIAAGGEIVFDDVLTTAELPSVDMATGATLYFAGTLDNSGATFTPAAGATISGTISGGVISGTILAGNGLSVGGDSHLTIEGARIEGAIEVGNGLTLNGGTTFSDANGSGPATVNLDPGSIGLEIDGTQTLTDVTFNLNDGWGIFFGGDFGADDLLTLANSATINALSSEAILSTFNSIVNQGDIEVAAENGLFLDECYQLINAGSITIANGETFRAAYNELNVGETGFTNTGTIEIGLNSQLIFGRDPLETGTKYPVFSDTGDISGAGTLELLNGVTTLNAGATLSVAVLVVDIGATLSLAENLNYAGAFTQKYGSTLGIADDSLLTLTGAVEISGLVTGGALAMSGGGTLISYRTDFEQAVWSISGAGEVVTLDEFLTYAGAYSQTGGATFTLEGVNNLTLTGSAEFDDAIVDGSHRLFTQGTTAVSGLTIGGTAVWGNLGTATQRGGDVAIGDASASAAILYNIAGGIYDIADDRGIGHGASAASYLNNAGLFEKTGGAGTSAITANVYNSGTIEAASGTLDFQAALWGTGRSEVSGGAMLEVDGAVGARQTLAFAGAGTISLHDLDIGGAKLFHGTIDGFGAGDSLEFGTAFGAGTVASFGETAGHAFGYLTLTNGSLSATIKLLGDYTIANFTPSLNASGETVLTYHA